MSRNLCRALGSWCVLVVLGTVGRAQPPGATSAAPSTLVAVVDIAKVFESHPTFKTSLDSLQQQAKTADLDLEGKKKSLTQRGQQLTELDSGSPDYRQLEADLARQAADLQVQAHQVKKDLLQREALQYYTSYNEILAAVDRIAQRHGIALVLRFDSRAMDPEASAIGHAGHESCRGPAAQSGYHQHGDRRTSNRSRAELLQSCSTSLSLVAKHREPRLCG